MATALDLIWLLDTALLKNGYHMSSPQVMENLPNFAISILPEFCTKYRSEAQKALFLERSWSDFDPQAYYRYGEDQNHETSFKDKALQAAVDSWCKIQVILLEEH